MGVSYHGIHTVRTEDTFSLLDWWIRKFVSVLWSNGLGGYKFRLSVPRLTVLLNLNRPQFSWSVHWGMDRISRESEFRGMPLIKALRTTWIPTVDGPASGWVHLWKPFCRLYPVTRYWLTTTILWSACGICCKFLSILFLKEPFVSFSSSLPLCFFT